MTEPVVSQINDDDRYYYVVHVYCRLKNREAGNYYFVGKDYDNVDMQWNAWRDIHGHLIKIIYSVHTCRKPEIK